MEKYRSRNYCLVLYPEDSSHALAVEKLKAENYKFICILHDKDSCEDGSTKKKHWHIVIKFGQARWNTAVASELGIEPNYLEACRDMDSALLYLVHSGHDDKFQYDSSECFGPLVPALNKLLVDDDEGMRVLEIVYAIDRSPGEVTYREILVKACNAGLYGEFRRLGAGVKFLIDEHNSEVNEVCQRNDGVMVSREAFNAYLEWTGNKNVNGGL